MAPRGWVRRSSRGPGEEVLKKRLALAGFRKHKANFKAGKLLDSMSDDSELSPRAAYDNRGSNYTAQPGMLRQRKKRSFEDSDDDSPEALMKDKPKGTSRFTPMKNVASTPGKEPRVNGTTQQSSVTKPTVSAKEQPKYRGTARVSAGYLPNLLPFMVDDPGLREVREPRPNIFYGISSQSSAPMPAPPLKRKSTYQGTAYVPPGVKHVTPKPAAGLKRKAGLDESAQGQIVKKSKSNGKAPGLAGTEHRTSDSTAHASEKAVLDDNKAEVRPIKRPLAEKPLLSRGENKPASCKGTKRKAGRDEESTPLKRARLDAAHTPQGLVNCSNYCFLNAVMQCLSRIPELTEKYIPMKDKVMPAAISALTGNSKSTRNTAASKAKMRNIFKREKIPLSAYFGSLVHELCTGNSQGGTAANSAATNPNMFAAAFGEIYTDFDGDVQQDPAQFIELLFNRLHQEDMDIATTPEYVPVIEDLFRGEECKKSKCHYCGHQAKTLNPFWTLQLPVKPTLPESMQSVMGPLDQDAIAPLVCDQCGQKGTRQVSTSLSRAPRYLLSQLSRAARNGKNVEKVALGPQAMDMTVCANGGRSGVKQASDYRIHAIVKHRGKQMVNGHCISQVQSRGRWWTMDDSTASRVTQADVFGDRNGQPYLLFLRRNNDLSNVKERHQC